MSKNFQAEIDDAKQKDFFLTLSYQKKKFKVRVVKIPLSTGEVELLLANVGRTSFCYAQMQGVYQKRWAVESKYNDLKNKLLIENFSGRTEEILLQDFFATLTMANLAAALKKEADEEIKEVDQKKLCHSYQANLSLLIGFLKNKIISILKEKEIKKQRKSIIEILEKAKRNKVPIRPNRSFDRPNYSHHKKLHKIKYSI